MDKKFHFGILAFALIAVVLIAGCTQKQPPQESGIRDKVTSLPESNEIANLPQAQKVEKTVTPKPEVKLQFVGNSTVYVDPIIKYRYVLGEVQNIGTAPADDVTVIATFYDAQGNVLTTINHKYTSLYILLPNEKSPYKINLMGFTNFTNYKLAVNGSLADSLPYRNLKIQGTTTNREILYHDYFVGGVKKSDGIDHYHVVGEVKNTGTKTVDEVEVIGSFYDESGQIIRSEIAYTNPPRFAAGQTAPFELFVEDDSNQIKNYELVVQGTTGYCDFCS